MTALTHFFKESDSSMGVFYPLHYIIATFPTFESTSLAAQALQNAGYSSEEVLAVRGSEILKYFEEFRANSGLWSGVMTMLSRAFGTEQIFADDDAHDAREGAGFLAIHSPAEADAKRIQELLIPFGPKAMHWYLSGGVQILT